MSGWLEDVPMPPCPECAAEVDTYTTDRKLEGRSVMGALFYSPPKMHLNPCGHEVSGYSVIVKWTPVGPPEAA